MPQRIMTNICSKKLAESKTFYQHLFAFKVAFESDWFVQLVAPDNEQLELGIIAAEHEIVPSDLRLDQGGSYITLVVEDVDVIFEQVKTINGEVLQEPHDTFYGQRRLLLKDPDGVILDVSAPIPNFSF